MIKKLQAMVGSTVDGYAGKDTIIKLQTYLKKHSFYKGAIDGIAGSQTVIAWQKYLNSIFA